MKCFLLGVLGFVVAGGICAGVLYTQMHGFNARGVRPGGFEKFMVHYWMRGGMPSGVANTPDPLPVTPENIAAGRDFYVTHCAFCHGNNGAGKTEVAAGMYPRVPNLRDEADLTDGQLFYIVREGIRYSGMPGWGPPDNRDWQLVQFIRYLPKTTPQDLQQMDAVNHLGAQ